MKERQAVDRLLRRYVGIGVVPVLLLVIGLGAAGVVVGVLFPKFEATALLQFPEAQRRPDAKTLDPLAVEQRLPDPKANLIEFSAYKRVAASYDSPVPLRNYIAATGLTASTAAEALVRQAGSASFWEAAAVPILPFSRRDQKEFGDIKDAPAAALLGLELVAVAPTASMAEEMLSILAGYYTNAVLRERVRAWILAGKLDSQSPQKGLQADILRAELDIELYARRAEDMKAVLARHPDAARMDARQVVSVNAAEGGERYLSPLAQLVGAESAISQRREMIRRWQRESKQKQVLAEYFAGAELLVDQESNVTKLLPALKSLSSRTFASIDPAPEWRREAALRVDGALENFEVMRGQFGVRNGIRISGASGRSPVRLGLMAAGIGLAMLGALAFLRASLAALREDSNLDVRDARA
jgi:hypothetical protein